MKVRYINGSYIGVECSHPMDVEQVTNAVIVVKNEGFPFRGKPEEMADDVLAHIINKASSNKVFIPVVYESCGGIDKYGNYTTDVVFQAVRPFIY
jgi:hypothetical protein